MTTKVSTSVAMRVHYGDEVIAVQVRPQARRAQQRLAIHVEPDGRVLVDAPLGASAEQVLAGVKRRVGWIGRQLAELRAQQGYATPMECVSGESLLYLGRRYTLKVVVASGARPAARMRGRFIEVTLPERSADLVRTAIKDWYRERAAEVLTQRLRAVAEPLRWVRVLPPLRLRFMTRQWGSCSPRGRITMNPWLIRASRDAIDYVLLHELCHLRHHNHGRAFYDLLRRHLPDWKFVKHRLDGRSGELLRA